VLGNCTIPVLLIR